MATETSLKEHAEALVGAGQLRKAAALINAHLAAHDAGWGLWNTLATLSRRLGRYELAVAAYRSSARQLEAAGHVKHAHTALTAALSLTPADRGLRDEVVRLSGLMTRGAPGPASRPTLRIVPPQKSALNRSAPPAKVPKPVVRSPSSRPAARTAAPVGGSRRGAATLRRPLEIVTDPHLAIFDILDAEKRGR